MGVCVAGGISGADLNPAVTLAAITRRTISISTGLLYMLAQVAGAFGMAVLVFGLSVGGPTGYAINPARDFGPRLFAALIAGDTVGFSSLYFLVPLIGPLVGGVAGAWFYDGLVRPFLPISVKPVPQPIGVEPDTGAAHAA